MARLLRSPPCTLVDLDCRFDSISVDDFARCFKAGLERDDSRFRKGNFDGFEDFGRSQAQFEGDPDVALDVAIGSPHDRETDDEDQFLPCIGWVVALLNSFGAA